LVTSVRNFDVLPAFCIHGAIPQPSVWSYRRLLSFARRRYEHVIFDLPEVVNIATDTVVTSARAVYVVCTQEVASLVLARKRCSGLLDRGVSADRMKIVLNRYSKDGPDLATIEEILGRQITQLIPNDYQATWKAQMERRLVADKSVLGRAFESFAGSLTGKPVVNVKPLRKLFGLFTAA
jgi:pilus assembly protein CpaE